jgi:U3 small nucleolar ribonucleoprotein protein LCP5
LVPVYNDIDETPQDKMNKKIERLKRRALSSSMMKELENEYSGAPEEIKENYANALEIETQEERHRIK